jgi:methenyltetrahydromethanopterin cyclohydrolase
MGRTNDCVLYGSRAHYTVLAADEELSSLAEILPSSSCSDYGSPFSAIFKRYDHDFYKIDPTLFSAAEIWLTSAISGLTFQSGRINPEVLKASLYER